MKLNKKKYVLSFEAGPHILFFVFLLVVRVVAFIRVTYFKRLRPQFIANFTL